MLAGYWHTTYFPTYYWNNDYWLHIFTNEQLDLMDVMCRNARWNHRIIHGYWNEPFE